MSVRYEKTEKLDVLAAAINNNFKASVTAGRLAQVGFSSWRCSRLQYPDTNNYFKVPGLPEDRYLQNTPAVICFSKDHNHLLVTLTEAAHVS